MKKATQEMVLDVITWVLWIVFLCALNGFVSLVFTLFAIANFLGGVK